MARNIANVTKNAMLKTKLAMTKMKLTTKRVEHLHLSGQVGAQWIDKVYGGDRFQMFRYEFATNQLSRALRQLVVGGSSEWIENGNGHAH